MHEYLTEAIVLDREPVGERDSRVTFFTKRHGKLIARARSARAALSKLSAHLEPGLRVRVRLVEKRGLIVADALKHSRPALPTEALAYLKEILPEAQPEPGLWKLLIDGKFDWINTLRILGWDPGRASCAACGGAYAGFHIKTQAFSCLPCASKLPRNEVIFMNA